MSFNAVLFAQVVENFFFMFVNLLDKSTLLVLPVLLFKLPLVEFARQLLDFLDFVSYFGVELDYSAGLGVYLAI